MDDNRLLIALVRCGSLQGSFSQQCRNCISIYLVVGDFTSCLTEPADRYQTSYGLMLLSRKELKDTQASGFTSQSQFRGYLRATVSVIIKFLAMHYSTHVYR